MPVLMNKGDDARRAAWLFYTDREALDAWGRAIVEGRWDSARLVVDAEQVQAAKKASAPVEVWALAKALIPEDFDIEAARGEVMSRARAELERARQAAEEAGEDGAGEGEGTTGKSDTQASAAADPAAAPEGGETADAASAQDVPDPDAAESDEGEGVADPFDYEPVPASEGLRVLVGTTTRQAAQSYLLPHGPAEGGRADDGEQTCDTDLPGLQMLAQLIDYMRDSSEGLPAQAVWHIDPSGILRMVRAKKVKVMAGNVLSVKS